MNDAFARAPHLRPGAADQAPHAALMIDFDNVTMGIRSNLGQELQNLLDSDVIRGKVSIQRAYADWRRYPQYIVPLSEASVDLIFAPAYGSSKKNATDIRLAIDATEIVFTRPEIGTFILLSGDSDFSSLVLKLKEYGKYVIGVGMQESSSDLLVQNCDEYYSYNSLSGLTSASDVKTETFDPWVLAGRTIQRMIERKDVMRSDRFKQVMLEFDSSFSEKSLGFSKFNRFLAEAASRGIIELEKAANGQYEVSAGPRADEFAEGTHSLPEKTPGSTTRRNGGRRPSGSSSRSRSRRGSSRRGRESDSGETREAPPSDQPTPEVNVDRLKAAYALLQTVVEELSGVDEPVRDSEIKRQMLKRDAKFDEGALGFRKFSRFLRQAHDEEIISLEQGPEGNYLVSPIDGPSTEVADDGPGVADDGPGVDDRGDERTGGRGSARGRGRGRERGRGRGRGRGRTDATAEAEPDAPEAKKPEPEPEAAAAAPTEPEASSAGIPEKSAAAEAAAVEAEPAEAEAKPARTLGRFRRGSKGRSSSRSPAGSGSKIVPGPVPEAPRGTSESAAGGPGTPVDHAAERVARDERRAKKAAGSMSEPSASAREFRTEIEEMSRTYPGVGKRTAERLYEEFGGDLLSIIDEQPERITAALPEHRARAVIEGRQAQRESAGA